MPRVFHARPPKVLPLRTGRSHTDFPMPSDQAGLAAPRVTLQQRLSRLLMPGWRSALATISMLGAGSALNAAMVFATQTLLARELGPDAYGLFASSLATVTMIAPLAGFGLSQFRLKAYGVEGWDAGRWLPASLRFTTFTTLVAMALVVGWALLVAPDAQTRFALLALSPVVLSLCAIELLQNRFRLEDRYAHMALWLLAIPASRLVVALLLLLVPQLTGRFVAISYGVIALVIVAWALPQLRAMARGDIDLRGHGPRREVRFERAQLPGVGQLWSQAWAYGMAAILYPVFFQVSTILLKYQAGDAPAGMYSIALAVMVAVYLVPQTIYQKYLLSKLHRWAAHDPPKFWAVYRRGNVLMLLLGAGVGVAIAVVSPWVVPVVFGREYVEVVSVLGVLALCAPVRYLSSAMGSALLTEGHMRFRVYAMAMATLVAVALNALLIPAFGVLGAAWATVAAETTLLLGTHVGVRRFHRLRRAELVPESLLADPGE
jgi:O-antigen/teichoic acid export membrane protein